MRILFKIALFFSVLFPTIVISQEIRNTGDSLYPVRYKKLQDEYIKMLHSESSIYASGLRASFRDKLHAKGRGPRTTDKETLFKYIAENLDKTSFESYEAAANEYEVVLAASLAENEKNPDFMAIFYECAQHHGPYMYLEIEAEVRRSNPEYYLLYEKK